MTTPPISADAIEGAARLIASAPRVYVIGSRSAYSFAHYTVYMARKVFDNFNLIAPSGASDAEDLAQMSHDDVIITFSSRPYSSETVQLVRVAQKLNIKTIAITDAATSPLAKAATIAVTTTIRKSQFLYQMGPFFHAIEQILETCFSRPNTKAKERIRFFAERVDAIRGYWR